MNLKRVARIMAIAGIVCPGLSGCITHQAPPQLEISPREPTAGQLGQAYRQDFSLSDRQQALTRVEKVSGNLPAGLAIQWSEGEEHFSLAGTPRQAGQWEFKVLVSTFNEQGHGREVTRRLRLAVEP